MGGHLRAEALLRPRFESEEACMFDEQKSYHSGRGRGRRDEGQMLRAYLHVEAGTRLTGLSINAFCKRYPLFEVVLHHAGPRRPSLLSSDTLRRTYVKFKAKLKADRLPSGLRPNTAYADALEQLVQQHMKAIRRQ
jgi:hypothetical protein